MPTNEQPHSQANKIAHEEEGVRRKSSERLIGLTLFARNRVIDGVRFVRVMRDVFAQPANQMPHTHHEERNQNGLACHPERLPQGRLDHRHKERREKERNGGKDGALSFHVLAPVILEYLVDDPIPPRLGGYIAGPLRVAVNVHAKVMRQTTALVELLIVECSLLRIDQGVVRKGKKREFPGRLL